MFFLLNYDTIYEIFSGILGNIFDMTCPAVKIGFHANLFFFRDNYHKNKSWISKQVMETKEWLILFENAMKNSNDPKLHTSFKSY